MTRKIAQNPLARFQGKAETDAVLPRAARYAGHCHQRELGETPPDDERRGQSGWGFSF